MKRIHMFILVLFSSFTDCYGQYVRGIVEDQTTHKPIPFASIHILDFEIGTFTDSVGKFEFKNLLPETFQIKVSAFGYENKLIKIENNQNEFVIYLESTHLNLDEVNISGSKGILQKNNAIHIETKDLNDLNSIASSSLGEALSNIAGVYQSTSGVGISKPVVRGMQGIRVVTFLNGLRIENQQWGGDHGMGITELGIGSVEVIKGPASLLYGADALGGVIYFIDAPYAKQNTQEIGFKTQFETNTVGSSNQLWFKNSKKNYRYSIAGSYVNHADYKLSNGLHASNSRFSENGLKAAFGTNKKNWTMHIRYNYSKNWVGIIGESSDTIFNPLTFQVNEQLRKKELPTQLFQNHFLMIDNKWFRKRNEFNLLVGQTYNALQELEEDWKFPGISMQLFNTLYTLKVKTYINEKFNLISGMQGMFQQNVNAENATEKLIPSSQALDNGIFSMAYYNKGKWNIQAGLRYDIRFLETTEKVIDQDYFKKSYQSINFSSGMVRAVKSNTTRLNISSGFRAPHLSELLANGIHHGALRYEIGERDLVSERATQFDFSYELHGNHLELIVNPFFSSIANYISIQPTDSIIENFPVYLYSQLPFVNLIGSDLGLHYHPHFAHWLHIESTYSFIQSYSGNGDKLALMPQNRLNTFLKFKFKSVSKIKLEDFTFQHVYYSKQERIAVYETRSPAYHLMNASLNFSFSKENPFTVNIGVKNVFNVNYIDHLSRIKNIELTNPGRNYYVTLKYNFIHSSKKEIK